MYKMHDPIIVNLDKPEDGKDFTVGVLINLYDTENKLIAKWEVEEITDTKVIGKVTNTYNNKRRKNVT